MAATGDDWALGNGHVALVTGSTDGIGAETARNLAATGATVIVHGRDAAKGERLVADLPGEGHAFVAADFADADSIRDLAATVGSEFDRLDALVNNAGTMQGRRRLVDLPGSDAGVEMTFAVNHLAPFLLTNLLADRLAATGERRAAERANEGDDGATPDPGADPARVVTVSSGLHRRAETDLDGVRGPAGIEGMAAYDRSKLANVQFTFELARRLPDSVTATCCHPGISPATGLARDGSLVGTLGWKLYGVVGRLVGSTDSVASAAETPTYLARSREVTGVTGAYFEDRERARPSEVARDSVAQRDLWRASAEWVGLSDDEAVGTGTDPATPS